MEGLWIGILGTAGTVLSTIAFMPQVIRTWRTRSAADISAASLVVALASMLIWIGYGSLFNAPAVVLVNILCFVQYAFILFVKLQTRRAAIADFGDPAGIIGTGERA